MYNDIVNMPSHIDINYDVDGTLFMVYLYPLTGTFEIAQWADGEEHVIDGFFDPLDITDYDEYYGEHQVTCFCYDSANDKAYDALECALSEAGYMYDHNNIDIKRIDIYGHDYEPPEDNDYNEIVD